MSPIERIAKEESIDRQAAIARLSKNYLSIMCDPTIVFTMPGIADNINGQEDDTKAAIIQELTDIHAIEFVDGAYVPTPEGRAINDRLTHAALKF